MMTKLDLNQFQNKSEYFAKKKRENEKSADPDDASKQNHSVNKWQNDLEIEDKNGKEKTL